MWLEFMTTTLVSDGTGPASPKPTVSRGRVQAAMKHDGTCTGSCWARNSSASSPTMLLNVRLKVPRLANPTSHAMSVTGRSVWRSRVIARSTRRRWR